MPCDVLDLQAGSSKTGPISMQRVIVMLLHLTTSLTSSVLTNLLNKLMTTI